MAPAAMEMGSWVANGAEESKAKAAVSKVVRAAWAMAMAAAAAEEQARLVAGARWAELVEAAGECSHATCHILHNRAEHKRKRCRPWPKLHTKIHIGAEQRLQAPRKTD